MDLYSTHLEILEFVFEQKKYKTVVEFGMGYYSTPFFLKSVNKLISVEMQNAKWYEELIRSIKNDKWNPVLCLDKYAFLSIDFADGIDCCFVDGHGDTRPECVNHFFGKAETIIVHDTEYHGYGWERVKRPIEYEEFTFVKYPNYTTVYSIDKGLIQQMRIQKG
jgi:hypothetical protein